MNSWQQILDAYPYLRTIWESLTIMLPLSALLAYSGIFFLSATSKIIAISRNRPAFNKNARQVALLGLILGWCLLVGSRVWLYYTQPPQASGELPGFVLEMSWLLLSIGVLICSVYYALWGVLKNMPVLLATIGMIGAVQNVIALAIILCAIRLNAAPLVNGAEFALTDIFPHTWSDPLYSVICYTVPLIFAMAGAFSACWLIIRRKKDDFGRDYYKSMIAWCSAWARNCWFCLWLLLCASSAMQFWLVHNNVNEHLNELILDASRILLWLIPFLLWLKITRADIPSRYGIALFLAAILACAFTIPYFLQLTVLS